MEPAIRTAQTSDIDAVLALWANADAEPTHTDDPASLGRLLERDRDALIVAEADALLVGSVIAGWDGWRGSIYRLVVASGFRRCGLGRQLVREAERRLEAVGAIRLQAIVVETDPRAIGFWRRSGWEEQVARSRFVHG
jgi:ribosomal protein S18 acetylase RimI-like enzyme